MKRLFSRATAALAVCPALSGCALTTRRTIQGVKYNPGPYHDRKVRSTASSRAHGAVPLRPFQATQRWTTDWRDDRGNRRPIARPTRGAPCAHGPRQRGRGVWRLPQSGCTSRKPTSTSGADARAPLFYAVMRTTTASCGRRRRIATPLRHRLKDRGDDLRCRELTQSSNDLEQPRQHELLAEPFIASENPSVQTRRPRRPAARITPHRRSSRRTIPAERREARFARIRSPSTG